MKFTVPRDTLKLTGVRFPDGITELDCNGCEDLIDLEGIPKTITKLLVRSTSMTKLEGVPPTVTHLDCGFSSITTLRGLPDSITTINCELCGDLKSLRGMPQKVKKLNCSQCNNLKSLAGLAPTVLDMNCNLNKFKTLEGLERATSLVNLDCQGSKTLTSVGFIPKTTRIVDIDGCDNIVDMEIPITVELLYCNQIGLEHLPLHVALIKEVHSDLPLSTIFRHKLHLRQRGAERPHTVLP